MHKLSLLAAFAMFLLTLLRWTEVVGMDWSNLFNSNKKNNSKNYSRLLSSSSTNFSSPLSQSSSSAASSSASLPFNPLQSSSSAIKSSAPFIPASHQSTSLFRAPKPSFSSSLLPKSSSTNFSSFSSPKLSSTFFWTNSPGQPAQSSSNQLAGGVREKALKTMMKIRRSLLKNCAKLSKEECSDYRIQYESQTFSCTWNPNVGTIGNCEPSKESRPAKGGQLIL